MKRTTILAAALLMAAAASADDHKRQPPVRDIAPPPCKGINPRDCDTPPPLPIVIEPDRRCTLLRRVTEQCAPFVVWWPR